MIPYKSIFRAFRFVFLLSLIFLEGCNSEVSKGFKLNLCINLLKENAWINLMPGLTQPTFHFVGNIKIKNEENETLKNLKLEEIKIFRDDTAVYNFQPVFNVNTNDSTSNIHPQEEKVFTFRTPDGLKAASDLNLDRNFSASLLFTCEGRTFEFIIPKIKIEKVY